MKIMIDLHLHLDGSLRPETVWELLTERNINEFDNIDDLAEAKIFDNKSLLEIWDSIEFISIDGCDPMERVRFYVGEKL